MTRVIAGTAGGRRLAVPPGTGTRPTSDRAREGLFSTWGRSSAPWTGQGSPTCTRAPAPSASKPSPGSRPRPPRRGRTARREDHPREHLLAPPARRRTPHRQSGADRDGTGARRPVRPGLPRPAVRRLRRGAPRDSPHTAYGGWLSEDALVTVERSTRGGEFGWPAGFEPLRARRYGEGTFWYGRAASTCEDAR